MQLPLTSLAEHVAWTRHVLAERLPGPTVLAGHSYAGAVISGAATGIEKVDRPGVRLGVRARRG